MSSIFRQSPDMSLQAEYLYQNSSDSASYQLADDFWEAPASSMDLYVNVAGTWKLITALYVNVAGTWKQISSLNVNVAGAWKQI